jgi:DNA modification methylase
MSDCYWSDEKHGLEVRHVDAFEEMAALREANRHFDLCLADPPYGVDAAHWDVAPTAEFRDVCLELASTTVWFGGAPMRSLEPFVALEPDRMLVWAPSFTLSKTTANGMYFKWHPIWCWNLPTEHDGPSGDVLRTPCDGRNWWHHPHTKPVPLMKSLVGLAPPDGTVLDPFMGSGTTLVAAYLRGRRAMGFELIEEYCEIAAQRLELEMAQGRLFEAAESKQGSLGLEEGDADVSG